MVKISHDAILKGLVKTDACFDGLDAKTSQDLLRGMLRLRRIEEALINEYHPADEMRCPVHFCVGQEAVSASLSQLFKKEDYMFSHHRSHGYYFAKNAPTRELFAELYGKATGANGGKAGSQDISHSDSNMFAGAILAGAVAIAVGAAFAEQIKKTQNVVVTGFGEAATDEGTFWEAVNFAVVKKLPMVFICENNRYSTYSPQLNRQVGDNLSDRVAAFGMPSKAIFGNDVGTVYKILRQAFADARSGKGPTFVECYTYRWNAHVGPESDTHIGYRTEEEIDFWKTLCPVQLAKKALVESKVLKGSQFDTWEKEIQEEIADAFQFAKTSPFPVSANWSELNLSTTTPLADKLLQDVESTEFNQYQAEAIPGPY